MEYNQIENKVWLMPTCLYKLRKRSERIDIELSMMYPVLATHVKMAKIYN